MVMPFELINTPDIFQDMMNQILNELQDEGVVSYIDDVLIYAQTEEKHNQLIKEILKRLGDHHFNISPAKCMWRCEKVEVLGSVITPDSMQMSKENIEVIKE
jgi:hypothetical protein